ncbi:MAG: hypothetical protein OHK0022_27780 [Roseiflexaceae bacterium]
MVTGISIRINADDDAMVGSEGWGEYDAASSTSMFEQSVADAVAAKFPGASVSVSSDYAISNTRIVIDTDEDERTDENERFVRDIIGDVWESWDWLVKA